MIVAKIHIGLTRIQFVVNQWTEGHPTLLVEFESSASQFGPGVSGELVCGADACEAMAKAFTDAEKVIRDGQATP